MADTLDPAFTLLVAPPSDVEEVFRVLGRAFETAEMSIAALGKCDPEDVHQFYMQNLAPRWTFPDITIYKIEEVATGRIAGWTALQYPWNERPISEDLKAVVNSHDIPPLPKGANPEAVMELFRCLGFASDHGYSMETDYHRKGTMIHPDFQKRGFGTALTKHVNAISDKTGGRVFAPALRSSRKMFLDNGFKAVGVHDAHLERWGGSREESITTMVLREPPIAELA